MESLGRPAPPPAAAGAAYRRKVARNSESVSLLAKWRKRAAELDASTVPAYVLAPPPPTLPKDLVTLREMEELYTDIEQRFFKLETELSRHATKMTDQHRELLKAISKLQQPPPASPPPRRLASAAAKPPVSPFAAPLASGPSWASRYSLDSFQEPETSILTKPPIQWPPLPKPLN